MDAGSAWSSDEATTSESLAGVLAAVWSGCASVAAAGLASTAGSLAVCAVSLSTGAASALALAASPGALAGSAPSARWGWGAAPWASGAVFSPVSAWATRVWPADVVSPEKLFSIWVHARSKKLRPSFASSAFASSQPVVSPAARSSVRQSRSRIRMKSQSF